LRRTCIPTSHNAGISPARPARAYDLRGTTANPFSSNYVPSSTPSQTAIQYSALDLAVSPPPSAFPPLRLLHPPSPTVVYIPRYMVTWVATLCHWACYEFGSANTWVGLPLEQVHVSMHFPQSSPGTSWDTLGYHDHVGSNQLSLHHLRFVSALSLPTVQSTCAP
jgi:hypothetical protein